jgi:hypothetical protein
VQILSSIIIYYGMMLLDITSSLVEGTSAIWTDHYFLSTTPFVPKLRKDTSYG